MFSFHKPRVYRSSEGCCICRAKTSSSRFIESKKYERDAMKCFLLEEPRKGEICNACVLLVKRFKRLPAGSNKNWGHVVDARCGSSTKSQKNSQSSTTSSKSINGGGNSISSNNSHNLNSTSRSLLPEKFAKIFKKTKKSKHPKKCVELQASSKRKPGSNGYDSLNGSAAALNNQPTTPDSVDSDCEDGHYAAPTNGTQVEFQTQTRASSYRTRKSSSMSSTALVKNENAVRKRLAIKLGSKRRKFYTPRKRRLVNFIEAEEKIEFFDINDWQQRKTCCGISYTCPALGNATLIQNLEYQPCQEHLKKCQPQQQQKPIATMPAVAQIPAAAAAPQPPCTNNSNTNVSNNIVTNFKSSNSTPVLKKHHLFFKRQSESFPHGDINTFHAKTDNQQHQPASVATTTTLQQHQITITPAASAATTNLPTAHSSSNAMSTSVSYAALAPPPPSQNANSHQHLVMSSAPAASTVISTTHTTPTTTTPISYMPRHSSAKITTIATPMSAAANSAMPMYTTSSSSSSFSSSAATAISSKSQHFLHKIKATDSGGKIVKQQHQHSLDNKLNTTVRIKTSDLHDMKQVIKTVDKSYVLAKPTTITPINCSSQLQQYHHHSLAQALHNSTTIAAGAASPSSSSTSSTSSSSTKFSDNSSDSGFDENMLDRKSASPLQEDTERKIISRPGIQTMFLSSGVQIQGQHQNLVLTGNEVAAKLMQNRRTTAISNNNNATITVQPINTTITPATSAAAATTMMHHHQQQQQQYTNNNRVTASSITLHNNNTTSTSSSTPSSSSSSSTVKIAQIISSAGGAVGINNGIGGSHVAKMRAIYNNNTIQHENGVTTIVPASSLAAATQSAAMNAIAPSTVTITPAPMQGPNVSVMKKKSNNVLSNKSPVVNNNNDYQNQNMQNLLVGNNISMYSTQQQQQYSLQQQHHHNHHHHQQQQQQQQQHPNQKIILLKTAPPNMVGPAASTSSSCSNNNSSTITSKYVSSVATQNLINKAFLNATTMTHNIATLPPSTNIIKTRP